MSNVYSETEERAIPIPRSIPQTVSYDKFDTFLELEGATPTIQISLKENWIVSTGMQKIVRENREIVNQLLAKKNIDRPFLLDLKNKFSELKKKDPLFFPILFNLGSVHFRLNEYRHAISEFEKVTHVVSQYWLGFFYLAKSQELMGNIDEAIKNFRLSYKKNPFELSTLVGLGDLYLKKKRYVKGASVYRYCLSINRDHNDALIGLGKIYFHQEKYNYANIWFRKVDQQKLFDKLMYFYYAEASFFAHNYQDAVNNYELALANYTPEVFKNISETWLLERKEQATVLLEADQ